jgi:hypothetical protein
MDTLLQRASANATGVVLGYQNPYGQKGKEGVLFAAPLTIGSPGGAEGYIMLAFATVFRGGSMGHVDADGKPRGSSQDVALA